MGGYVYLICDLATDTYKIGRTKNSVEKRLKQIQTGCSSELFIMNYYYTEYPNQLEQMLHRRFKSKQQLNEWFRLEHEDIFNFTEICEHTNGIIKALHTEPEIY